MLKFSTVYLDSQKDRLYCLSRKDPRRVLTQNVLFYMQHTLMLLLVPFMPYSMEEFYSNSKSDKKAACVLLDNFWEETLTDFNEKRFSVLMDLRTDLNKMFEKERSNKTLSKNNEVFVYYPYDLSDDEVMVMELMLGKPHLVKGDKLKLVKHNYQKCNRCWNYFKQLKSEELCSCCHEVENM